MGRPSKLTPAQWAEVERRLLAGEPLRKVAADYGVTESTVRGKLGAIRALSAQSAQVQETAQKVAEANRALEALPASQRPVALDLAALMTRTLASVAEATAMQADTGRRVAAIANQAAQELEPGDVDGLKLVAAASRTANEAMAPAIQLLTAREKLQTDKPDGDAVPTSGVLMVPGLATDPEAWAKGAKAG